MTSESSASDVRAALIVRPSALGDVCRTAPVLASLRRALPNATIDWVVQDTFIDAVAHHPSLDRAIGFPRRKFARWWRNPRVAMDLRSWARALRTGGYDLAIDCQGLARSAWITRTSGARSRIGHRSAREGAWLSYTRRVAEPEGQDRHTVDRMLDLVAAIGIEPVADMLLHVGEQDRAWWEQQRRDLQVEGDRFAVLAAGARWTSKLWPMDHWLEVLKPLAERGFDQCVVVGAPNERDQLAPLLAGARSDQTSSTGDGECRIIDLVGRTSIGQMMAVIKASSLVIANDSAPLHMAVGLGTPSVGLFGPTDPALVGPYSRGLHAGLSIVVQRCTADELEAAHFKDAKLGDRLMRRITANDVTEAIDELLAAGDRTRG